MNTSRGFSLTEVLVSLLLVTTTSCALLTQQWRISQLFNQAHARMSELLESDNAEERVFSHD